MSTSPMLPKLVGQRVKRREDPRLIQGRGTYVDDVKIAGLLHLAFKRSDVAHGRIRSIDTSAAAALDEARILAALDALANQLRQHRRGAHAPSRPARGDAAACWMALTMCW